MFITIPADVALKIAYHPNGEPGEAYALDDPDAPDAADGKPWPVTKIQFVRDFLRRVLMIDKSWGSTMDLVYTAQELRGAFHGKTPGDVVETTKAQHDALMNVMRAPSAGYSPVLGPHMVSFFRAIEKADVKAPSSNATDQRPQE